MDVIRKYLVRTSENDDINGADIVERLVDRFQSSTRIDDRRDALRALKSLSKKYRLEVGTQAMPIFLDGLKRDRDDIDSCCYCLDALCNVMNDALLEQLDAQEFVNVPCDLGGQFTEMFVKSAENVELVLSFVDTYELHVRRNALRLLTILLRNRLKQTQTAVLQCPLSISKLVDVLDDSREILRNDALLLLLELTKCHMNIQKIVAFENIYERLLKVMQLEGLCGGGVIVEDCLRLLCQLLEHNAPNQTLFREGSFIQQLPFLTFGEEEGTGHMTWSAQKVVNVQLMLEVVRNLVSPRNKTQAVRACQAIMHDCGLLRNVSDIVMASGVPVDVLTTAVYTVAEMVRGCERNQTYLAEILAPSEPPQPAITVLLFSMINERQALHVRIAGLYCFQCFIFSNPTAQADVVATLLPKTMMPSDSISAGQLLCSGLFSKDSLSTWFSAVALMHCIHANSQLKEDMLRVHIASTAGGPPVTLLQQCFTIVNQTSCLQTKLGMLQLLCVWLAYCPAAVRRFLTSSVYLADKHSGSPATTTTVRESYQSNEPSCVNRGASLSMLVAEASTVDSDEVESLVRGLATLLICICVLFNPSDVSGFDKNSLLSTIDKRIGMDVLIERLSQVSKSEPFTAAQKTQQPCAGTVDELIFDYEFTQLFKTLEYDMRRMLEPTHHAPGIGDSAWPVKRSPDDVKVTAQYEEKLVRQTEELSVLRSRVSGLEKELATLHGTQATSLASDQTSQHLPGDPPTPSSPRYQLRLKLEVAEARIEELESKLIQAETDKQKQLSDQEDLLMLLHEQDCKIEKLTKLIYHLGGQTDNLLEDGCGGGGGGMTSGLPCDAVSGCGQLAATYTVSQGYGGSAHGSRHNLSSSLCQHSHLPGLVNCDSGLVNAHCLHPHLPSSSSTTSSVSATATIAPFSRSPTGSRPAHEQVRPPNMLIGSFVQAHSVESEQCSFSQAAKSLPPQHPTSHVTVNLD